MADAFRKLLGRDRQRAVLVLRHFCDAHRRQVQPGHRIGERHDVHRLQHAVPPPELELVGVAHEEGALHEVLRDEAAHRRHRAHLDVFGVVGTDAVDDDVLVDGGDRDARVVGVRPVGELHTHHVHAGGG